MKKIKVGVIGLGKMGMKHLTNYLNIPGIQVIGAVDPDEEKLLPCGALGIKAYNHYNQIIDEIDAVSIATPSSTHFDIASEFLRRGKHILLEKPMTNELHEAKKLIELAEENKCVLAVGHIERFNPVMGVLEKFLHNEKPIFIDIQRESPYDSRIFDVDVIHDLMIHDIDLLNYLLKEKIYYRSAYGVSVHSSRNDIVNAQFISESGILINITTSRVTERRIRTWRLVMKDKLLEGDLINRNLIRTKRKQLFSPSFSELVEEESREMIVVPCDDPLNMEIMDFLNAIKYEKKTKVGGVEGFNALKVTKDIQEMLIRNNKQAI
jgi:predicted dehydrogenase